MMSDVMMMTSSESSSHSASRRRRRDDSGVTVTRDSDVTIISMLHRAHGNLTMMM